MADWGKKLDGKTCTPQDMWDTRQAAVIHANALIGDIRTLRQLLGNDKKDKK